MEITTIGLDLAKNVFQVHAINGAGEVVVRKALRRAQVLRFFERLDPCLVGIEACGTSHYWAREISKLGHEVRLMPPAYVKPYVKRGKTDASDAEAICEAVSRPTMRYVAIKSCEQQAALTVHRTRDLLVKQRTQLVNMIRGLLAEFGIEIRRGITHARFKNDRQKKRGVFQTLHGMCFAAVEINPVPRTQLDGGVFKSKFHGPFQTMQRDVSGDLMRRDFRASADDQTHGFETVRLDNRRCRGVLQRWSERSKIDDFSRFRVV